MPWASPPPTGTLRQAPSLALPIRHEVLLQMSLLVVGCNHHSADLSLLERLAVAPEELPKALRDLLGLEHVLEAAVLSTCNRVEVYAHVTRFHPGLQELRGWLAERADVHPQELDELQYSYHDDRAAAHLFSVAGGLDSMVVGERQIALQVKQAMETAREEGAARRVLLRLFRQAVGVGRRIRQETDIGRGASSMVDVGLEEVEERLGRTLAGRRVAVVGAGKVGALTADRLAGLEVAHVDIWNRSPDKAHRIASRMEHRVDRQVVDTRALADAVAAADVVICTTGAPEPVLDRELVSRALARRVEHDAGTLVLLDLGVPRNVDPACATLPGLDVIDVSDVRRVADRGATGEAVAAGRVIVEEEAGRYAAWTRAAEVEPTIRAVRERAEQVRSAELQRLDRKLGSLDERQRAAVEALSRGIVNTLLHGPTVRLKELADAGGAEHHTDALRELFELPVEDVNSGDDGS